MNETHLCNCGDDCPAPFHKRLIHIDDECIHTDGRRHKIK